MDYKEGAARIGKLEPIFSPLQSLIRGRVHANKPDRDLHFPRESVSPEEAKIQRAKRADQ